MNAIQVKIVLLKKGLSIAAMARELRTKTQTEDAVRVMLSQMIHGRRFYPALAKRVNQRYGIKFERPTQTQPRRKAA